MRFESQIQIPADEVKMDFDTNPKKSSAASSARKVGFPWSESS